MQVGIDAEKTQSVVIGLTTAGAQCGRSFLLRQWAVVTVSSCDQLFPIGFTNTTHVTSMRFPHRVASTAYELQSSAGGHLGVKKSAVIRTLSWTQVHSWSIGAGEYAVKQSEPCAVLQ